MVIGGSHFSHRLVHKVTWVFRDRQTENQIDHISISRKWRQDDGRFDYALLGFSGGRRDSDGISRNAD